MAVGDAVLVQTGGWREAVVEEQDDAGFYLLGFGDGERRWASGGEMCWHDVPPMGYDVSEGKSVIAWCEETSCFESAVVVEAKVGAKLRLRFDSGADGAVPLSLIRERWHVPLRVLLLWGDYHQATVMEAEEQGGLLRIDFGGGSVRWAQPEELLAAEPPPRDALVPGAYVGACLEQDGRCYKRSSIVANDDEFGGGGIVVMTEDGQQAELPAEALRLPLLDGAPAPAEGTQVHAVYGSWRTGVASGLADEAAAGGRLRVTLWDGAQRWLSSVAPAELVAHDGDGAAAEGAVAKLPYLSPVVARGADGEWSSAVFLEPAEGGKGKVVTAGGDALEVPLSDLRARGGAGHPVALAAEQQEERAGRFGVYAAVMVQSAVRRLKARRTSSAIVEGRNGAAATRLQAAVRRLAAVRCLAVLRSEKALEEEEAAAEAAVAAEAAAAEAAAAEKAAAEAAAAEAAAAEKAAAEAAAAEKAAAEGAAVTAMQAAARGLKARNAFATSTSATLRLQSAARMVAAQRVLAAKRGAKEAADATAGAAAARIQARVRGHSAQWQLARAVAAATRLQAAGRGNFARGLAGMAKEAAKARREKLAATKLQTAARASRPNADSARRSRRPRRCRRWRGGGWRSAICAAPLAPPSPSNGTAAGVSRGGRATRPPRGGRRRRGCSGASGDGQRRRRCRRSPGGASRSSTSAAPSPPPSRLSATAAGAWCARCSDSRRGTRARRRSRSRRQRVAARRSSRTAARGAPPSACSATRAAARRASRTRARAAPPRTFRRARAAASRSRSCAAPCWRRRGCRRRRGGASPSCC